MAFETTVTAPVDSGDRNGADAPASYSRDLQGFVFALFFAFGGITSLNDVLIPKLKALFTLSYGEVMLVQSAFFAAYFIVSLPAAALVRRIGYMRSAAVGLLTMTVGCLLFVPASSNGIFALFLVALFVLAAGITTVQVVANPLISMLGPAATASSRLTFAQAFNSLGTTIFPYVGSMLILGSLATVDPAKLSGAALDAFRGVETQVIVHTYMGLAIALLLLATVVWVRRKGLIETPAPKTPMLRAFDLLTRPRFAFGTACIFLYVGGEVAIGSLIVNYLMQSSVLGLAAEQAGKHVPFYWGGAMLGRFIGAYVLRLFAPGKVLACVAAAVITLLWISSHSTGTVSAYSLLAIGLFNSIMFPTIFSLASEGLGKRAAEGSGVICMAIVGGAIVPLLAGTAADLWGLKVALIVPAACYCGILAFGWYARRPLRGPGVR
ncbi:MAG: transporter, family, L-fucose permease [Gammaproteobacteria bacterium]|jgi:FHS family L-fucose permease-like MFS transporter|nr:transporter, family, L-fucose permease [Gammaproteobacteria bacterium]